MNMFRKSFRPFARPARFAGRSAQNGGVVGAPRTVKLVTGGLLERMFDVGGDDCECAVCAWLSERDIPYETLPDGTVVHSLTEEEAREICALMPRLSAWG
jgi:hypothetical protein